MTAQAGRALTDNTDGRRPDDIRGRRPDPPWPVETDAIMTTYTPSIPARLQSRFERTRGKVVLVHISRGHVRSGHHH